MRVTGLMVDRGMKSGRAWGGRTGLAARRASGYPRRRSAVSGGEERGAKRLSRRGEEDLGRRAVAQNPARSVVEPVHDVADLGVRDVQEVRSFGEIAPHQAVGVFVGPALPRGIRVGEEKVRLEFARHGLVAGELGAVVGGDGQYPVADRSQQANHHPPHRVGAPVGHPAQQDETAAALRERDEVALLPGADDGVGFPVAQPRPVGDTGRALVDGPAIGNGEASRGVLDPVVAWPPVGQVRVKRSTARMIVDDVLVNPFVADGHPVDRAQIAGDLLRAPVLAQLVFHHRPAQPVDARPRRGARASVARQALREPGIVERSRGVASALPPKRAAMDTEIPGDGGRPLAGIQQRLQLQPRFQREVVVAFH